MDSDRPSVQRWGSGGPWEQAVGYSRVVRAGDHVYVAGTTAIVEGRVVGVGDAAEQTRVVLDIIARALEQAGSSLTDVVRTRMFVVDIDDWEAVGRIHGMVFGDVRPVATLVEVSRLVDPGLLVEMEVDAFSPLIR
jgi:enamine deaminase RidA (YjgF/YER057c/UK114 family)